MNFAKRCCSDDANLCEVISVSPEEESASQEFIDRLLIRNKFEKKYREQLERTSATGTTGAYIYLKNADFYEDARNNVTVRGGEIRINYVDADCIIPLTTENGEILECAFASTSIKRGVQRTTLVIFIEENGRYQAETVVFDESGSEMPEHHMVLQLGEVKPFSILTNAEVNNLDHMEGYGLPKIYNAIPFFMVVDLCYSILYGDLDKGQKVVFLNELLASIARDDNGNPVLTKEQKKQFILLGEKLPDKDTLIHEHNPEIRVDAITKAFELALSLLSMQFGFGTKRYTFENGQIQTATEYIGERQDEMQELNKQRANAKLYIGEIIKAAMWFSNQFQGTNYNLDEIINVEFDDSYIEDRVTKLDSMRADALSFTDIPILKVWYMMEKYNVSEEEAQEYIQDAALDLTDEED